MVRLVNKAAIAAASAAMLWSASYPTAAALPVVLERQLSEYASLAKEILKAFGLAFPEVKNAWETDANPDMCAIFMETTDGGNCKASVKCGEETRDYNDWNVCYVGGRQFFTDDRIGDFSITFSQKDGTEGEGLTNPILQLGAIDNWREIPVTELAEEKEKFDRCMQGITTVQCGDFGVQPEPWVCEHPQYDVFKQRTKQWQCGMPKIGKGFLDFNSEGPVNTAGYAPGWCVAHITQYQKPNPATDAYGLEVRIYDNNQDQIGGTDSRAGPTVSLPSKLPWTLEIQTQAVDADPVKFQYGDQSWDSNDQSRCKVGAYDSGSRQMDCGFTCN